MFTALRNVLSVSHGLYSRCLLSHGLIVLESVLSNGSLVSIYSSHIDFLEIHKGNVVERRTGGLNASSLSKCFPISQLLLLK